MSIVLNPQQPQQSHKSVLEQIEEISSERREVRQTATAIGNWINASVAAACGIGLTVSLAPIADGRVCNLAAYSALPSLLTEALGYAFAAGVVTWILHIVLVAGMSTRLEALRLSIKPELRQSFREKATKWAQGAHFFVASLIIVLPIHIYLYWSAVSRLARGATMAFSDPTILNSLCKVPLTALPAP